MCFSFMRWPTKAVAVHFHLLHRSHLKIGYLDISVTRDFCNCQPLEIRLLHLANYCFTGTVIGKPLLRCLKAGSGDDFLHHGVDFIFSHGLYLLPNFVTGSTVVLYQEIKWTTPTQIGRSTAYVQTKIPSITSTLPVNTRAQNMFSRDVKCLSFRCQTLKFSHPNVKFPQ